MMETGLAPGQWLTPLDRERQYDYIAQDLIVADRADDGAVTAGQIMIGEDEDISGISRWV